MSRIEDLPAVPLKRDRESFKCKVLRPVYCSSLAIPAAKCGGYAHCSIFNGAG